MGISKPLKSQLPNSVFVTSRSLIDPRPPITNTDQLVESGDSPSGVVDLNAEHFEWGDKLGSGAFGTVMDARPTRQLRCDPRFEDVSQVAVKIVDIVEANKEDVKKEFATLQALGSHAHIVSSYGLFFEEEFAFMVLERVGGRSVFDSMMARGTVFSELHALRIMRNVFNALDFIHCLGYAHMDIKSENVMFAKDCQGSGRDFSDVRVIDFGLSVKGNVMEEMDGGLRGTPPYADPAMMGSILYSPAKSDVWSAGIMFVELLCGGLLYNGSTFNEVADDIRNKGEFCPFVEEDVRAVCYSTKWAIQECLRIDPLERCTAAKARHLIDLAIYDIRKQY